MNMRTCSLPLEMVTLALLLLVNLDLFARGQGGVMAHMGGMNMTDMNDTMDHDMDHDTNHTMDHGPHHTDHGERGHALSFYFSDYVIILFSEWQTDNKTFIPACVGTCLVAIAYEGVKALREYLLFKALEKRQTDYKCCTGFCAGLHFLQTFLHVIQTAVSYALMLVFMTFNIFLCVSILIGAGLGYLIFGWTSRSAYALNKFDCCN